MEIIIYYPYVRRVGNDQDIFTFMVFHKYIAKITATFHKGFKAFRALIAAHNGLPKEFHRFWSFLFTLKLTAVYFNEPVIKHNWSFVYNFAGLAGTCLGAAKIRIKFYVF